MSPGKRNLAIFLSGAAIVTGGGRLGHEAGDDRAKPYEHTALVAQRCAGEMIRQLGGNKPLVVIEPQDIEALPGCEQLLSEPMPTPLVRNEYDKRGRLQTIFVRPWVMQRESENYRATADQLRADFTSSGIALSALVWAMGMSLLTSIAGAATRRRDST